MNFTPVEQRLYALSSGDVLVTEGSGSRETVGASGVWRGELEGVICFQNTVIRLRPRNGISDGGYIGWWARHAHAAGLMAEASSGANILRLGVQTLRRLPITLPSIADQRRIADFLDNQIALIDNMITARCSQADRLPELFRRRLDEVCGVSPTPDYLMGVDGHGCSLRRQGVRSIAGATPDSNNLQYWVPDGVPWITIGDMIQGGSVTQTVKGVSAEGLTAARLDPIDPPVILFAMYASVGKTSISDVRAVWNQAILGLVPGPHLEAGYLLAWLELAKPVLPAMARSATQDNLNADQVMSMRLPVKTRREQSTIASAREAALDLVRRAEATLLRSIGLLEARKRSLITAAVTGEFDVSTASSRAVGV